MADDLPGAMRLIDAALLGQNLAEERAESLAEEVAALNERVRIFARMHLDFYDDPSFFLATLRTTAWTPPSPNER